MDPQQGWLTLRQAAERLGVHPTTLRRWADAGRVPVHLTVGGHRRFKASEVEAYDAGRRRLKTIGGLEELWAGRAFEETQRGLGNATHRPEWLAAFDDGSRKLHRDLGRRLMGLTLQYIAQPEGGEALLDEARLIGSVYAQLSRERGQALAEALGILFFFRDTMLEVALRLPEAVQLQPDANQRLFHRLRDVFNTVELAVVEGYQPPTVTVDPRDVTRR